MYFRAHPRMQYKSRVRVIAGTAKGRKLLVPRGVNTRPTPARVREALFSMIAAYLPQASVLDLFAGTGALGIEALSRGAKKVVFVEQDRQAIVLLKRNLGAFVSQAHVVHARASNAMVQLAQAQNKFDLIFLDPPYALELLPRTLQQIVEHGLLQDDGLIVCEHGGRQSVPETRDNLVLWRQRRFGDVALALYHMATLRGTDTVTPETPDAPSMADPPREK